MPSWDSSWWLRSCRLQINVLKREKTDSIKSDGWTVRAPVWPWLTDLAVGRLKTGLSQLTAAWEVLLQSVISPPLFQPIYLGNRRTECWITLLKRKYAKGEKVAPAPAIRRVTDSFLLLKIYCPVADTRRDCLSVCISLSLSLVLSLFCSTRPAPP